MTSIYRFVLALLLSAGIFVGEPVMSFAANEADAVAFDKDGKEGKKKGKGKRRGKKGNRGKRSKGKKGKKKGQNTAVQVFQA